jgi:hypothetical protein
MLVNWRGGNEKMPRRRNARDQKRATRYDAEEKSHGKYGWVHNFGFYQVNYDKH